MRIGVDGKLSYKTEANGDRVPDYSYCGYMLSETSIPDVAVKVIVPAMGTDATARIQAAIDQVALLPIDARGFRGAVLLEKGRYLIGGSLTISASGVVLRGSGSGPDETVLVATGADRETPIRITGKDDLATEKAIAVDDAYYPVNTTKLNFKTAHGFKPGDQIMVTRPSTKEWIAKIGADKIGIYVDYQLTKWDAGDFDQKWYRTVAGVDPQSITIDVPLTNSLDPTYGGGTVARYTWNGRIGNVGVENLRCISTYDSTNKKDENHRWMAITMDNVRDAWVRRVVAEHFVSSAVAVWESASRVTVEDCKSLAPVGEIGNHRRYSFHTLGQQVLFQRCYAEYGYHDFSVGFTAAGPNAFVQCYAYLPHHFSGAIGGWSTGVLFDKLTIDGGNLELAYRDVDGQGGGWSTANSLSWQTRAAQLHLDAPPGAQNWAYGSWAQGYGNGRHEMPRSFLKPESIFYAQLEARTGKRSPEQDKILVYESDRSTALQPETAARVSERSKFPDLVMESWIDSMIRKYPVGSDMSQAKTMGNVTAGKAAGDDSKALPISLQNGWIVRGGQVLTGRKGRTSLWRGTTRPGELSRAATNLVRFVPGRVGKGLTDNLDTVVSEMQRNRVVAMQNFPALWYERRRDDHARTRRADADVWAPFYEQPFSRSGQGEAFDRLSKYDLTKWNSWYWLRLKQFANLADQKGLLFIQEHYLQHNIIEEGAHWADYPWRTANNINNTGFAENTPYAGDKRVFMADEFYDTSHPVRRQLHRLYIRKSLDEFKGNTNIMHHPGHEYTGPAHFLQFWLDVVGEWERENHPVMVLLSGTKDVQDVILADPKRSHLVDAIDVIQWQYRKDSSAYAPKGGQSLAERQYARIMDVGETSFGQIYRAVAAFKNQYPQKAIVYSRGGAPFTNWAIFIGGGSLATLPDIKDARFFTEAASMLPVVRANQDSIQYLLGKPGLGYVVFSLGGNTIDLSGNKSTYALNWINPGTGEVVRTNKKIVGGRISAVQPPFKGAWVAWLRKGR
ncbi:pectate lyase [Segetibacter sp. 3557_3]|nr:pectate lyase [Segetibacter sp. 3557_3]